MRADGIENWLPLFYSSDLIDLTEFFDIKLIIADDSFLERAKKKIEDINSLYNEKIRTIEKDY